MLNRSKPAGTQHQVNLQLKESINMSQTRDLQSGKRNLWMSQESHPSYFSWQTDNITHFTDGAIRDSQKEKYLDFVLSINKISKHSGKQVSSNLYNRSSSCLFLWKVTVGPWCFNCFLCFQNNCPSQQSLGADNSHPLWCSSNSPVPGEQFHILWVHTTWLFQNTTFHPFKTISFEITGKVHPSSAAMFPLLWHFLLSMKIQRRGIPVLQMLTVLGSKNCTQAPAAIRLFPTVLQHSPPKHLEHQSRSPPLKTQSLWAMPAFRVSYPQQVPRAVPQMLSVLRPSSFIGSKTRLGSFSDF